MKHSCCVFGLFFIFFLLSGTNRPVSAQWTRLNGPGVGGTQWLGATDNGIFATVGGGLYRSVDNGAGWSRVLGYPVSAITQSGPYSFIGTSTNLYISSDTGLHWDVCLPGIPVWGINCFANTGNNLFAGTYSGGIYHSPDSGRTWNAVNDGLPADRWSAALKSEILSLAALGTLVFAGTEDSGVYVTADNGATWNPASSGLSSLHISSLAVLGSRLFAANYDGVVLSSDSGATWTTVNNGLTTFNVWSFGVHGTHIYVTVSGLSDGGLYRSEDYGANWIKTATPIPANTQAFFLVSGADFYVGTATGIYRSTDEGAHWTEVNNGLASEIIESFVPAGDKLFAGAGQVTTYLSPDDGSTWTAAAGKLPFPIHCMALYGASLFAGTSEGIYRSDNDGLDWTRKCTGLPLQYLRYPYIRTLAASGSEMYAGTDLDGFFRSSDSGENWTAINSLALAQSSCFSIFGNTLWAVGWNGSAYGGPYASTDSGTNWTLLNNGMSSDGLHNIVCITRSGSTLFAGTNQSGIHRSGDEGANWTLVNSGIPEGYARQQSVLLSYGSNVFAGTWGAGVYLTTDNGGNWTAVNTGLSVLRSDTIDPVAGGAGVMCMTVSGTHLLVHMTNRSVFRRPLAEMIASPVISSPQSASGRVGAPFDYAITALNGPTGFEVSNLPAGLTVNTATGHIEGVPAATGVTRAEISASNGSGTGTVPLLITIEDFTRPEQGGGATETVEKTALTGLTPNPFNPTVTLHYQVSEENGASDLKLKVFNYQGRLVKALQSGVSGNGRFHAACDMAGLPSGLYLFRFECGNYSVTKTGVLIK